LKGYEVTGLDASAAMLEQARTSYPEIKFVQGDATNFSLETKADIVFSNAVFHWIKQEKQEAMLSCINRALNMGGELVFEMGGYQNNKLIHQALREAFEKRSLVYVFPFYFPTIAEYATLLEKEGFLVEKAHLFDRPTPLKGPNGMQEWMEMFIKSPFENIDKNTKREIIEEASNSLKGVLLGEEGWQADYVRLRMKAKKVREIG
jgi:trans-aconitate methyltransferase